MSHRDESTYVYSLQFYHRRGYWAKRETRVIEYRVQKTKNQYSPFGRRKSVRVLFGSVICELLTFLLHY